jgi:hypothetical protein
MDSNHVNSEKYVEDKKISKKHLFVLFILKNKNIRVDSDILLQLDEFDYEILHKECIQYFKNMNNKTKLNIINEYRNPIYSIIDNFYNHK